MSPAEANGKVDACVHMLAQLWQETATGPARQEEWDAGLVHGVAASSASDVQQRRQARRLRRQRADMAASLAGALAGVLLLCRLVQLLLRPNVLAMLFQGAVRHSWWKADGVPGMQVEPGAVMAAAQARLLEERRRTGAAASPGEAGSRRREWAFLEGRDSSADSALLRQPRVMRSAGQALQPTTTTRYAMLSKYVWQPV
jgi:hypothetical protein